MFDIFGNTLYEGDIVVHADKTLGEDELRLDMYEIVSIVDEVATGELRSGEFIGERFYLLDTHLRSCLIHNPYKALELYKYTLLS